MNQTESDYLRHSRFYVLDSFSDREVRAHINAVPACAVIKSGTSDLKDWRRKYLKLCLAYINIELVQVFTHSYLFNTPRLETVGWVISRVGMYEYLPLTTPLGVWCLRVRVSQSQESN